MDPTANYYYGLYQQGYVPMQQQPYEPYPIGYPPHVPPYCFDNGFPPRYPYGRPFPHVPYGYAAPPPYVPQGGILGHRNLAGLPPIAWNPSRGYTALPEVYPHQRNPITYGPYIQDAYIGTLPYEIHPEPLQQPIEAEILPHIVEPQTENVHRTIQASHIEENVSIQQKKLPEISLSSNKSELLDLESLNHLGKVAMPKDKNKFKKCPETRPTEHVQISKKEEDERFLLIDELAEELLESYKEFPPMHAKVDKSGNLNEHWLKQKIYDDLCQIPPSIPSYIRMNDSSKLKVEKLRKMACLLQNDQNEVQGLRKRDSNLASVEELLTSRPNTEEDKESELDICENLDLDQEISDFVQESSVPNCEEMADSKLVKSHAETCKIENDPDNSMSISRYVSLYVPTIVACGALLKGERERELDDAQNSKELAKKENVEQIDINLNSNLTKTAVASKTDLEESTSEWLCTESANMDLFTEMCPVFVDPIAGGLQNLLEPKVVTPTICFPDAEPNTHSSNLVAEVINTSGVVEENTENSSVLETTFIIEGEEPEKSIEISKTEILVISALDKSEYDSNKPMTSADALDKELYHKTAQNQAEEKSEESTSGIIDDVQEDLSKETNETSIEKQVNTEILDLSKTNLQDGDPIRLSRWKLIDSLCTQSTKESDSEDKFSSSAYLEWPEILKKVSMLEPLEKDVIMKDQDHQKTTSQLSKEQLNVLSEQDSSIEDEVGNLKDTIETDLNVNLKNKTVTQKELASKSDTANPIKDESEPDVQKVEDLGKELTEKSKNENIQVKNKVHTRSLEINNSYSELETIDEMSEILLEKENQETEDLVEEIKEPSPIQGQKKSILSRDTSSVLDDCIKDIKTLYSTTEQENQDQPEENQEKPESKFWKSDEEAAQQNQPEFKLSKKNRKRRKNKKR